MFEKTRNGIREMKRAAESLSGYWPDVLRSFIAKIEADLAVYDDAPGELEQIAAALTNLRKATGCMQSLCLHSDESGAIQDNYGDGEIFGGLEWDKCRTPDILSAIEAAMLQPKSSIEELEAACYAAEKEHKESHLKMVILHNQLLQAKAARKGTEQ